MPSFTTMKLGLVSLLASGALAVPYGGHGHAVSSGFSYSAGNGTHGGYYPTASGRRGRKNRTRTSTATSTSTMYETVTISAARSAGSGAVGAAAFGGSDTGSCKSSTVYHTETNYVTVTVQASSTTEKAAEYTAPTTSAVKSSTPAKVSTPVAAVSTVEVVPVPASSSAVSAPVEYSSSKVEAAAVSITLSQVGKGVEATSSAVVVPTNTYVAQTSTKAVATSAYVAPSSTATSSGSTGGKKRGIAYNGVEYTTCFAGQGQVSWAYNWGQVSDGISGDFEYVPMLWGNRDDFTKNWVSNAKKAISGGSTHILGFNEPDLGAQSNMDYSTAATAYKTYITDNFGGSGVRLGSPAVTNGGGAMGLTWLNNFMGACSSCQIDFVAIHWYDSAANIDYFKSHVTQAHTSTGKPVWLTEFGASGSDDEVNTFLQKVLPWLDEQDFVERYSYFMAKDGLLNKGTEMSTYGKTFATYSG